MGAVESEAGGMITTPSRRGDENIENCAVRRWEPKAFRSVTFRSRDGYGDLVQHWSADELSA